VVEMAVDNQVTIIGTLVDDPELKYTPNGAAVANMRIAWNRKAKDDATGQWQDVETGFFTVTAWRSLAENAAESLTRGMRIVVAGRLQQRSWETPEGDKRSVIEIIADEIGPSLRWATAKVEKTRGGGDWSARSSNTEQEEAPLDAR
jgi:single-strand DNA-binding protein